MATRQSRDYYFQPTAVAPSTIGSRFVNGDEPPQSTFKSLFDSTGFIAEAEDRAKENEQGFVRFATDSLALQGLVPDTSWSYAAKVTQLPTLKATTGVQVSDEPQELIVSTDGNILTRNSYRVTMATSFKEWLFTQLLPSGGTAGQILRKLSGNDFSVTWSNESESYSLPAGGTSSDVLKGNDTWQDAVESVNLQGGTSGQYLTKTSNSDGAYTWGTLDNVISGGTTGQVLKKVSDTEGDYSWGNETDTTYSGASVGSNGVAVFKGLTGGNEFQFHKVAADPSAISALSVSLNSDEVRINLDGITSDDITVQGVTYGGLSPASNSLTDVLQALFNAHP